ncbi:hypothetical protein B484DRAFT_449808 [Ochromonadaceae sp. CCMP2298]|nr:hypothetical protein B484DRAFT_449808 [Ochromonadaceae sp. CCMP2298]
MYLLTVFFFALLLSCIHGAETGAESKRQAEDDALSLDRIKDLNDLNDVLFYAKIPELRTARPAEITTEGISLVFSGPFIPPKNRPGSPTPSPTPTKAGPTPTKEGPTKEGPTKEGPTKEGPHRGPH